MYYKSFNNPTIDKLRNRFLLFYKVIYKPVVCSAFFVCLCFDSLVCPYGFIYLSCCLSSGWLGISIQMVFVRSYRIGSYMFTTSLLFIFYASSWWFILAQCSMVFWSSSLLMAFLSFLQSKNATYYNIFYNPELMPQYITFKKVHIFHSTHGSITLFFDIDVSKPTYNYSLIRIAPKNL